MSDDENRSFATSQIFEEALDAPHDISKTLATGEALVDMFSFGSMQLLDGTARPTAIVPFAQPSIRNPASFGVPETYLSRGYRSRQIRCIYHSEVTFGIAETQLSSLLASGFTQWYVQVPGCDTALIVD